MPVSNTKGTQISGIVALILILAECHSRSLLSHGTASGCTCDPMQLQYLKLELHKSDPHFWDMYGYHMNLC